MRNLSQKSRGSSIVLPLTLLVGVGIGVASSLVLHDRYPLDPSGREETVQRAKDAVIEELRRGDFLKKEMERGIAAYIQKQRQARVAARAAERRKANERAQKVRPVSAQRDHIFGNAKAPISLIEYSDFECPFCKRFHRMPKKLVAAYKGKVNWVYRHFPLKIHNPGAQKQAEASECAREFGGTDAFWKYTDAIYTRTRSNGRGFALDALKPLAIELGLDGARFQKCLESGKHAERVLEDFQEGRRSGVTGTPTTIILNNQTGDARFVAGVQPIATFKNHIQRLLDQTPTPKTWR